MQAKEIIERIIIGQSEECGRLLKDYPIDSLLPFFMRVSESFIRPAGWYLLSENEKVLKIIEWMKTRFKKGFDIEFKFGEPVEETLKKWVIDAINYQNLAG